MATGDSVEVTLAIVAVGWAADTAGLKLAAAGVEVNQRGSLKVDQYLRTSAPHIFAAGDITGRLMLVPEAVQDGFLAATNAVQGTTMPLASRVSPAGSFTEPEYSSVGLPLEVIGGRGRPKGPPGHRRFSGKPTIRPLLLAPAPTANRSC